MTSAVSRLVTVMYHYVRDAKHTQFPDIKAVSVADFRRQVAEVKRSFETPPLEACIEFLEGRWTPNRDICILTFDDGLREHYDTVAHILAEANVPGAFFLPTAAIEDHEVLAVHMNHFLLASLGAAELTKHIDKAAHETGIALPTAPPDFDAVRKVYRWDDAETARLKYLVNHRLAPDISEALLRLVFAEVLGPPEQFAHSLYVDWTKAAAMQAAGFAVGGHTHRHKALSALDEEQQRRDLERSTTVLSARLGAGQRAFAYPYGKPSTYTQNTVGHLKRLGYFCAFNTTIDHGLPGTSRWEIPRIDPKDL